MLADSENTEVRDKIEFMDRLINDPTLIPGTLSIQEFENLLDIMLFFVIESVDAVDTIAQQQTCTGKNNLAAKAFEVLITLVK